MLFQMFFSLCLSFPDLPTADYTRVDPKAWSARRMSVVHQITKIEAAHRQLATGVRMLFTNQDAVSTHTLFGASATLFGDLARKRNASESWDQMAHQANGLELTEYLRIIRTAQNFFKHAASDPDGVFDLDPSDTEATGFVAVMNATALGAPLTFEAQVFQLWYIAANLPHEDTEGFQAVDVNRWFGADLRSKTREERLAIGLDALNNWRPADSTD
ncbi:hypothetical protein EMIT0P218_10340 [Pseudomonas sp. IT-P218]